MIIYLDVLFIKEILFNSIIIFLTGKIINQRVKFKKIILASLFGAIYSTIIIVINYNLSSNSFLNFICAIIMNLIVFENKNLFVKNIITFYFVTFVVGGVNLYAKDHTSNLYLLLALTLILIPTMIKKYKEKYKLESYYGKIISLEDNFPKELKVFIDTGNNLKTCYGEPVVILSNQYQIEKNVYMKNLRTISYKTINEEAVCANGVKIKKVILEYQKQKYENEAVFIKSNVRFEEYDAIIGLDFFECARKT